MSVASSLPLGYTEGTQNSGSDHCLSGAVKATIFEGNRPLEMSIRGAEVEGQKSKARSRISNGSAILPGVDGRSTWVRRLRDLIALHLSDLGGDDVVSEAERSIIRRAAVLETELERLELAFALAGEAEPAQIDLYQRTANSLRRLLESVGLQRRPREVESLSDPLHYRVDEDEAA